MRGYTHLHWYQCNRCKRFGTSPVLVKSQLKCPACLIWLAYQWSESITTDEQRARAEGGIVFSVPPPPETKKPPMKKCGLPMCVTRKTEDELVQIPGVGKFCSSEHAEEGQRNWNAFMERLRKLREERPWLDIEPKTPSTVA